MDRFIKKRKLDDATADDQTKTQEQSTEATARTASCELNVPKIDIVDRNLKVRQYSDNYLAMGFTWAGATDCPLPLCVVCGGKLADSAMAPAKLKRHLTTKHPDVAHKNVTYFERALSLNKMQTPTFEKKFKISDKAQETSYAVAGIVAKKMKSHILAETVFLPACREIVRSMFGKSAVSDINKIPLSDNTIRRRISDMSSDIESHVLAKIKTRGFFALQVQESTDVSGKSQLMGFVRFIDNGVIVEVFFCCKELPETTKEQDIFDVVNSYLQSCDLNWKNFVGICTDGVPAMRGNVKGFVSLVPQMNPGIMITHCFIHREALVAKTVGAELKSVLDMVVKTVNYMKMRPLKCRQFAKLCESMEADHVILIQHTDVRWLSRGKVCSRFYELREEMLMFCSRKTLKGSEEILSSECWWSKLAYLADVFHELNILNSGMQGRHENVLTQLTGEKKRISEEIVLSKYVPSIYVDQYNWVKNPFVEFKPCQGQFTLKEEEELVNVASDRTLKLKHAELNFHVFWLLIENEYQAIDEKALRLLLQFSTSCMCEFGFSAMTIIKYKKRERLLSVEDELRVSLSNIRPRIQLLCRHHQAQVSH